MQTKFFLLLSILLTGCSPIAPEVRLFGILRLLSQICGALLTIYLVTGCA
ncbi:MAG: hypothetical protein LUQ06_01165 [Methylococcaceae bacterium]|nr:hypothetical protein [Methylococcaceae bacterium]